MKFVLSAAFMAFAIFQIGTVTADPTLDPTLDLTISDAQRKGLLVIAAKCAQKHKFPLIDFNKILDPTYEHPTQKEQCFVDCVLGKDGLQYYYDGYINEDNIQKMFPASVGEQRVTDAINYCAKLNIGFCGCKLAFKLFRCAQNLGLSLSP